MAILYELVRDTTFIAPVCDGKIVYISDTSGTVAVPVFTSNDKFNFDDTFKLEKWRFLNLALLFEDDALEGIVINPGDGNLFLSKEMIQDILFGAM